MAKLFKGRIITNDLRLGLRGTYAKLKRVDNLARVGGADDIDAIRAKLTKVVEELKVAGLVEWDGIAIAGDVEDDSAGDVEGALIELIVEDTGKVLATTETDASGDYSFDELDSDEGFLKFLDEVPEGEDWDLIVRASKEGFVEPVASATQTITPNDDGQTITVATITLVAEGE